MGSSEGGSFFQRYGLKYRQEREGGYGEGESAAAAAAAAAAANERMTESLA